MRVILEILVTGIYGLYMNYMGESLDMPCGFYSLDSPHSDCPISFNKFDIVDTPAWKKESG